jgi:uncharacterized protein YxjI
MRQRLLSIGEDFTIANERGEAAFDVDGKVLTLRETFELKDRNGRVVATIRGRILSLRDTMDILRDDEVAATIVKAIFAPFRDRFRVDVAGGPSLSIAGSLLDHEYTLRRDDDIVATVSKRWFTITDTYGIEVAEGEDDALILAIAVALDEMAHDPDEGRDG